MAGKMFCKLEICHFCSNIIHIVKELPSNETIFTFFKFRVSAAATTSNHCFPTTCRFHVELNIYFSPIHERQVSHQEISTLGCWYRQTNTKSDTQRDHRSQEAKSHSKVRSNCEIMESVKAHSFRGKLQDSCRV